MRHLPTLLSAVLLTACTPKARLPSEPAWLEMDAQGVASVCVPVFPSERPLKGEPAQAWIDAVKLLQDGDRAARGRVMGAGDHPALTALAALADRVGAKSEEEVEAAVTRMQELADAHPDDACAAQAAAMVTGLARSAPQESHEAAKALIERAYALAPDDPRIAVSRAILRTFDDTEVAAKTLDDAIEKHPRDPRLRLVRALFHREAEQHAESIPHLQVARDEGADIETLLLEASWLVGDFEGYLREASRIGMPLGDGGTLAESENPIDDFAKVLGLGPGQALVAVLKTSQGDITCSLMPDMAPLTVANFVGLARGTQPWTDPVTGQPGEGPYYDGTVFHRVIPDFMVQGGDRTGTGRGDPGYRFPDEANAAVTFGAPGILAMANSGPDTNGSQFFITDGPTPHLNGRHTIFGVCDAAGQAVIKAIGALPRGEGDRPVDDVILERVVIEAR